MSKRIAIIGAGATGMTAAKACLEQGLSVVVFEKTYYTGGLWRYQEELAQDGIASVMRSTIINSSKEMSAFSDFPPPADYPNYMHNSKMVAYFDLYAQSFGFEKYVKYRREIVSLELANDYTETGKWEVTSRDLNRPNEEASVELFDGVMICTGHHGKVYEPKFEGQDKFKGQILHTHSLKNTKGFEDKTVVVVGIGNSGGDAAVELSYVTKQLYLSTRRGTWVNRRVGTNGQPFDALVNRRYLCYIAQKLPYSYLCSILESQMNSQFDHEQYGLKPTHRALSQHIMVNDALPNRILSGTIIVKGDLSHFTEDGVVFVGESSVTKCDVVILATGYKVEFPFLSQDLVPVVNNKVRLYKYVFVPSLAHPQTLAFIGLIQPVGALLPISEFQSRWFALLNSGKVSRLPTVEAMNQDIALKETEMAARYYQSERHTIQVDWLPYMDELAKEVGAFPPVWRYLVTDPKLFWALMFGPASPYQYRLVGPNTWSGAREAMLTIQQRIDCPLHTNHQQGNKKSLRKVSKNENNHNFFSIGLIFVAFVIYFAYQSILNIFKAV